MQLSIKGFIKSKESELFYDCADRFAYSKENHKFSISDGVSKSFFPKIWADTLVNTWVTENWKSDEDFIAYCQEKWLDEVTKIVNKPDTKWFTRNAFNRRESALATFVGLNFEFRNNKYYWKAQALGDSFLFFVPENYTDFDNEIKSISSKKQPIVFDNYPDYLSSLGTLHKGEKKVIKENLEEGCFYLMTDALAEWFLNEKENAIHRIDVWTGQDDFERFIDEERLSKRLGNDDNAILIIKVKNDGKKELNYYQENTANINELIEIEQIEIESKSTNSSSVQRNTKKLDSVEEVEQNYDSANQVSRKTIEEVTVEPTKTNSTTTKIETNEELEKELIVSEEENELIELTEKLENNDSSKKKSDPENKETIIPEIKTGNQSQKITDKF